jgi:hypothetical protein
MNLILRLALVPAVAAAVAGTTMSAAHASTEPLSVDAVDALAVASCQADPTVPLTLEELSPQLVAETDVDVFPGEISVHLVRAVVNTTSAGDVQEECTFGVLHRDAQLKQVQHVGLVTLARADADAVTLSSVATEIGLGNMGKSSPIDPTTEVSLGGFLTPLEDAVVDPTYEISLNRKSIQTVTIAVHRAEKAAAAHKQKRQEKAAALLLKQQTKAAHGKHSERLLSAAQRTYDKRVARAEAQYARATTPKTISRPVAEHVSMSGTISAAG